ncbi:MAG: hypothetical protein IE913_00270 [Halothiobacillus sp.]|nr:hypothetical protein [Halothiobacillus sp.]
MATQVANTTEVKLPSFLAKVVDDTKNYHQDLTAADAEVPRIKLMNPMSVEVADGAEPGKFLVTTDFTQFEEAEFYSIGFKHKFTVAFPRTSSIGDGIVATVDTLSEAEEVKAANPGTEITDTHEHIISVPEYGIVGAKMYLSGTALVPSKRMNAAYLTKYNTLPRHAVKWKMSVERKKNDKGFWFVPRFDAIGFIEDESLFMQLEDLSTTLTD